MKRVKLTLTCKCCGREFEHINFRRNCADAENYEAWARENVTICPGCLAAERQAAKDATLADYIATFPARCRLPEITGVSDKQIAFARDLRNRVLFVLMDHNVDVANFFPDPRADIFARLTPADQDKIRAQAKAQGMTVVAYWSDYINDRFRRIHGYTLDQFETALTESNAAKLIDALR